ncbi:hypothetical protein AURDEDRAFT_166223 [Auricularia subglabra TFB-10046 SS5]|nr:hypothetical protein AURDEDRAFT_166223 [Auricularia subglabra TFB-10046 SS5]
MSRSKPKRRTNSSPTAGKASGGTRRSRASPRKGKASKSKAKPRTRKPGPRRATVLKKRTLGTSPVKSTPLFLRDSSEERDSEEHDSEDEDQEEDVDGVFRCVEDDEDDDEEDLDLDINVDEDEDSDEEDDDNADQTTNLAALEDQGDRIGKIRSIGLLCITGPGNKDFMRIA